MKNKPSERFTDSIEFKRWEWELTLFLMPDQSDDWGQTLHVGVRYSGNAKHPSFLSALRKGVGGEPWDLPSKETQRLSPKTRRVRALQSGGQQNYSKEINSREVYISRNAGLYILK